MLKCCKVGENVNYSERWFVTGVLSKKNGDYIVLNGRKIASKFQGYRYNGAEKGGQDPPYVLELRSYSS